MKNRIPAQLESAYIKRTHKILAAPTLAEVEAMAASDCGVMPVVGDCMEGAGIPDGGFVAVSFRHFPRPPRRGADGHLHEWDTCLCWIKGENGPFAGIKEYAGVWGPMQMVSTRYKQQPGKPFRMNWMPPAERIFGVVFACWDPAGRLLWQHDLEDFPRELGTAPTIRGVNVGNPQPVAVNSSQAFKQKGGVTV
jgi:hypothetical protein